MDMSRAYWTCMRRRKEICFNAENKIGAVQDVIKRYPGRKALIFSHLISYAERITDAIGQDRCGTFHSNIKDKQAKEVVLRKFAANELHYISSVRALNAGLDIPECSLGISTNAESKKLAHVQRNGRTSRYIDGKISYFVNLYAEGTQEAIWLRKGTISMEPKWIEGSHELPVN